MSDLSERRAGMEEFRAQLRDLLEINREQSEKLGALSAAQAAQTEQTKRLEAEVTALKADVDRFKETQQQIRGGVRVLIGLSMIVSTAAGAFAFITSQLHELLHK